MDKGLQENNKQFEDIESKTPVGVSKDDGHLSLFILQCFAYTQLAQSFPFLKSYQKNTHLLLHVARHGHGKRQNTHMQRNATNVVYNNNKCVRVGVCVCYILRCVCDYVG